MIHKLINSFAGGEGSDWLAGRIDIEKYGSLCRVLENFLLTPYGGVRRRPGLEFVGEAKNSATPSRLIPFQFSTESNFVLAFNDGVMRILRGGSNPGFILNGGTPLEVPIPWADEDLIFVQFTQLNDILYFTHPDYAPQKLTRFSDTNWLLEEIVWKNSPVKDQNISEVTLDPSAATGAGETIVSSVPLFLPEHVGSRWELCHEREGSEFELILDLDASGTSGEILIQGDWQMTTNGRWGGVLGIEIDRGNGFEPFRSFDTNEDRNIRTDGFEADLVKMRMVYTSTSGSDAGRRAVLEARQAEVCGEFLITAFVSPTEVTVDITRDFFKDTATELWSEAAFSDASGYPRTVTFHEGRLLFGGTRTQPQTVWGSQSDDFENFKRGTGDADSYVLNLTSGQFNEIRWMVSERRLLIGTSGSEFVVGSGRDDSIITPTNIQARRHSNFGSAPVQPVFINDSVLYAQRHARKIREYGYVFERDRYQAADVTLLGEHITGEGVIYMGYQQQRDSIVWCINKEGELIGMTYEKDQNITGWHRQVTKGKFESHAVIFGELEEDEVWSVVNRTVNGQTRRYYERMKPNQYRIQESEDKPELFYVDAGITSRNATEQTVISGLDHLEGEVVSILGDGAEQPDRTVENGQITLETPAAIVTVGLKFASRLEPMVLETPMDSGPGRSREARINRVYFLFWKTLGGYLGETSQGDVQELLQSEKITELRFRDTEDPMGSSPPLFTGEREEDFDGDYQEEGATLGYINDSVYPAAVQMMIPKYQMFGDD